MYSPQVAKAEAILRGIELARDSSLLPIIIERDAVVVVKWINKESHCGSDVGLVIVSILFLIKSLGCVVIGYVPCKANQVAHVLTKNTLLSANDYH